MAVKTNAKPKARKSKEAERSLDEGVAVQHRVLVCSGGRFESQANAQVRESVMDGWAECLGEEMWLPCILAVPRPPSNI